jgi:hypothetical protein
MPLLDVRRLGVDRNRGLERGCDPDEVLRIGMIRRMTYLQGHVAGGPPFAQSVLTAFSPQNIYGSTAKFGSYSSSSELSTVCRTDRVI